LQSSEVYPDAWHDLISHIKQKSRNKEQPKITSDFCLA